MLAMKICSSHHELHDSRPSPTSTTWSLVWSTAVDDHRPLQKTAKHRCSSALCSAWMVVVESSAGQISRELFQQKPRPYRFEVTLDAFIGRARRPRNDRHGAAPSSG